MRTGNVIEAPGGGKWIVTDVHDHKGLVEAVSFDMENCSATQKLEDYERQDACRCTGDCGHADDDCEYCHGRGEVTVTIKGWKRSKVLAYTVHDFILNGIKKAWGI